jgi:membrane protein YqaA with SNARE-associated domain
MVGIIIGAIIVLTFCDYIEKATTGTLLGTIIGYALGRLKTRPRAFNK